jgi:hypothetical protein
LAINVYDCSITTFSLSVQNISLELNSSANTLMWSKNAVDPLCGTYSITSNTPLKISSVSPSTLTVSTSTAESYAATLTLIRDDVTSMTANSSLQVNVYDCKPSGFTLPVANVIIEVESAA